MVDSLVICKSCAWLRSSRCTALAESSAIVARAHGKVLIYHGTLLDKLIMLVAEAPIMELRSLVD